MDLPRSQVVISNSLRSASVVELVRTFYSSDPLMLAEMSPVAGEYYLVVVGPDDRSDQVSHSRLRDLCEAGARIGLVTGNSVSAIHQNLAKVLSTPQIDGSGKICFPGVFDREPADEWDVLILSGHGNGLDVELGNGDILCAREGIDSAGSISQRADVFPCFHGHGCFRTNPSDDRVARLISARTLRAKIVVACGCNIASVLGIPFDPKYALIEQLQSGYPRAVIASSAMLPARPEIGLLAASLISEGLPFGDVVRCLNENIARCFGKTTTMPPAMAPFLLFGDPRCRVVGWPEADGHIEAKIDRRAEGVISIRNSVSERVCPSIQITKFATESDDRPFLFSKIGARENNPIGIWYSTEAGDRLSVLFCAKQANSMNDQGDRDTTSVTLTASQNPILCSNLAMIDQFAVCLNLWIFVLANYEEKLKSNLALSEHINSLFPLLARAQRQLLAHRSHLTFSRGILINLSAQIYDHYYPAVELIAQVSAILCKVAAAIVRNVGSSFFLSWDFAYQKDVELRNAGPCSCGTGLLTAREHILRGSGGPASKRAVYECNVCGPVGEDDGNYHLMVPMPPTAGDGNPGAIEISFCAPEDKCLSVAVSHLLESWYKDELEANDNVQSFILQSGEQKKVTLRREPLYRPRSGLHVSSCVGVLNGALFIRRGYARVEA